MESKNGFAHIILLSVLVIIALVFSYLYISSGNITQETVDIATPISIEGSERYVDDKGNYSIYVPEDLKMTVYKEEYVEEIDAWEKIVIFCDTDLAKGDPKCPSGGIQIWVNGDGWGGGCDPREHADLLVGDEELDACLYETGFSHVYVNSDVPYGEGNRYLINGGFSEKLTKDEALKMLSTFTVN